MSDHDGRDSSTLPRDELGQFSPCCSIPSRCRSTRRPERCGPGTITSSDDRSSPECGVRQRKPVSDGRCNRPPALDRSTSRNAGARGPAIRSAWHVEETCGERRRRPSRCQQLVDGLARPRPRSRDGACAATNGVHYTWSSRQVYRPCSAPGCSPFSPGFGRDRVDSRAGACCWRCWPGVGPACWGGAGARR